MYAVIQTGGKQYRVQPGDLLVVEKLPGEPGAAIAFDQVLMVGRGEDVSLGAPTVAGASVEATLIETRKGEKIKIFKKIRRQGYRRTRGHRQIESVLRITGIAAEGGSARWEGTVDLTPRSVLNARARNLARGMEAAEQARLARASVKAAVEAAPAQAGETEAEAKPAPRKRAAAGARMSPSPAAKKGKKAVQEVRAPEAEPKAKRSRKAAAKPASVTDEA